jgi:hypothetical protein
MRRKNSKTETLRQQVPIRKRNSESQAVCIIRISAGLGGGAFHSTYKCEKRKLGRLHVLGMSIDESSLGGECCDACESYVYDPRGKQ